MAPPWDRETDVCLNGLGHMTKMVAIPIYGKNLKKLSSSEPKGRWHWKLVCNIGCSSTTKSVQKMTLGWPWSILVPYTFVWGKRVKQLIFMIWSNLFPNASARVKAYAAQSYISKLLLIQHILCIQVSDTGPMVLWFYYGYEGPRLWERKSHFNSYTTIYMSKCS